MTAVTPRAVIPFTVVCALVATAALTGCTQQEAAEVDGAGRLRTFIQVVLPMSRNSLITAGLFAFLYAWSHFMFALTLNTTDDVKPVTLGIYQYIGAHVGDWGSVMAPSVLSAIPAAVLLVLAQKYIAAGITGGSVK